MKGCDFAWGVPPGRELELARALKRQGFGFVVRYLSQEPSKNLTRAEVAAYRHVGLHIVTVYEDAAQALLGGEAVGRAQAITAKQQLDFLGAPEHAPVYFAVDFDVTPEQMPAVDSALDATAFVLTEAQNGIYGGYGAVTRAQHVRYRWQTGAWSAGVWAADASLDQIIASGTTLGVQWDLDESKNPDFGQWVWPHETVTPKPPHVPKHRVRKASRKIVRVTKGGVKKEPVMTASGATALATALVGYLQHYGVWHLDPLQVKYLITFLVAFFGIIAAAVTTPSRVGGMTAVVASVTTALTGVIGSPQLMTLVVPFLALFAGHHVRSQVSPKAPPAPPAA